MEEDEPPGVPEWVVTYGDMMSLLLTFFIMLVSMSEIVADQKYRAVLESLHTRMGYRMATPGIPGNSFPLNSVVKQVTLSKLGSFSEDEGFGGVRSDSLAGDNRRVVNMPEGSGRRIGEPVRFVDDIGTLAATSTVACERHAVDLRGKPNKLEVRSWIAYSPAETRAERVRLAYDRAVIVRNKLAAEGVEDERMRIAVVPVEDDAELVSSDLSRHGVVTIAVLDAYARDYDGARN